MQHIIFEYRHMSVFSYKEQIKLSKLIDASVISTKRKSMVNDFKSVFMIIIVYPDWYK
jgi:hypothetical protein